MPAEILADLAKVPTLDAAEKQVRQGLPFDAERLREASVNEDYYQFRNALHFRRRPDESDTDFAARPKRFSRLMRVAVRKISEPLYNPGPTRTWEGSPELDAALQSAYEQTAVNVRMASADRSATINHVAALQVEATGDATRPVRLWLWKGNEFAVWTRDGDPTAPYAVATLDTVPADGGQVRTRCRLWSAAELRTFVSDPYAPGGDLVRRCEHAQPFEEHPYPGVLPFVFVRNEPADSGFWEGGIGCPLREANAELDQRLSDIAQHVQRFLNPFGWARNIMPGQAVFSKVGGFSHLAADEAIRQGDQKGEPELGYLQAQLGVEAAWYDAKTAADNALEELEIPLTTVRSDASTDLSGIAIERKTVPLLRRTRQRQPQFGETEVELAGKILAVIGAWYGKPNFLAAAVNPALVCVWPEPRVIDTSSAEGLTSLQQELDMGMADPIEVLARLRGLTLDQAEKLAIEIAERRKTWAALMGVDAPDPKTPTDGSNDGADTADGGSELDPGEDDGTAGAEPEAAASAGAG
jgi:hypothetical protein